MIANYPSVPSIFKVNLHTRGLTHTVSLSKSLPSLQFSSDNVFKVMLYSYQLTLI